jgi:PAS domain S-box-containing protein
VSYDSPKRLLLVEDEAIIALDEAERLRRFGYEVEVVHQGEDAVTRIADGSDIDLILMDIDLGEGIDGRQAAERIFRVRRLPVVFLTSHAEEEMVRRVGDIARYGYVLKSAGDFVLSSSIEMALELFDAHRKLQRSEARYRSFFEQSPIAVWEEDFSAAKRKIDQLTALGITDLEHYLQSHPELLRELTTSVQVLDVNERAVEIYDARNKEDLLRGISQVFDENTISSMVPEFTAIAQGRTRLSMEKELRTLMGRRIRAQVHWSVLSGHEEDYDCVLVSIADVSELRGAAAAGSESAGSESAGSASAGPASAEPASAGRNGDEWFRKVVETAHDIVYALDMNGVFSYVSPAWEPLLGHAPEEVLGRSFDRFVHPDDVEACRAFLNTVVSEGRPQAGVEYRVYRKDGALRVHSSNAAPLWREDGRVSGYLGIARDITEATETRKRVDALLEEKELLLREVHHRVKNNLNTVAGILALQAETERHHETAQALREAQGRVQAMLRIYQTLFQSGSYAEVNLAEFLQRLVDGAVETHAGHADGVSVETDFEKIQVATDLSVPIGLLANELLTNAFKYAFPDTAGTIRLATRREEGGIALEVADDGVGLPAHVSPEDSPGFGLRLVRAEAKQLDAEVQIDRTAGTSFTVRFPLS